MAFTFLVLAYPGCHGKEAVKRVRLLIVVRNMPLTVLYNL